MAKRQNTSHAVMAQRVEAANSLDDFPTPPWATRALIEHVLPKEPALKTLNCLEPACGAGHMAKVLQEYFGEVIASDVHDYGYAAVADFLAEPSKRRVSAHSGADWIITNPPFKLAESFLEVALARSRIGVAMLTRTVFIESIGRYERLFRHNRPTWFAQFTERVPMIKGRLDRKASTATGYAWLVWLRGKQPSTTTELVWIPPCRKLLERDHDYDAPKPLTAPRKRRRRARSQTDLFAA